MEPESRYAFVGAIVLVLAAAAVAGFAWLSSIGPASNFRFYAIRFERQSLDGIQKGANVTIRGISVGRVEDYTIAPGNINVVRMTVRVDRATPVSENTVAVVARNFVTGIARIDLVTVGTPGPPLIHVAEDERYPMIAEGNSEFADIAESAGRLALTAEQTLASLNELLKPENREAFGAALTGARDLVNGLNQRLAGLDATTRSLRDGAAALGESSRRITTVVESTAAKVDPLVREAGAVLSDTRRALAELRSTLGEGRSTLGAADATLRDAQGTLQEFSRLAKTLETEAGALSRRVGASADIGVLEVRATAQELRAAAEMLMRTLERLQDPRAAILGPSAHQLGPGEVQR